MNLHPIVSSVSLAVCAALAVAPGCTVGGEHDLTPAAVESEVVYGIDNRVDVFAHPDAVLRARAEQSTVALIPATSLNTANPANITLVGLTLQQGQNLCATERFLNDPAVSECSGTLIDDDLVLTAGHCVQSAFDCARLRFVFNYRRTAAGVLHPLTTADVFSCSSIVAQRFSDTTDYAVIRLDRPATPNFVPAPIRPSAAMATGQRVAVIGTGSGIPFKIDSGGAVRDARTNVQDFFVATTDTFGGNSGSGVYDLATHLLAGILVRGDRDYVPNGSCNVVNTCPQAGCAGEAITYVTQATAALCAVHASARLCPVDQYLVGDWDGDERDNLAVRHGGCVFLDFNFDGFHDLVQCFGDGRAEDQYLAGDWDGDGRDNLAVRRDGCVFMDVNFDGAADQVQCFGAGDAEDQYLVGDWDGDGRDNLAVRRRNRVDMDFDFAGGPERTQTFGSGLVIGNYLVGDWDGDGRDNLAVRTGATTRMDFNFDGATELTQAFGNGNTESEYLAGDWDGDGRSNLAVRRVACVLMNFNFDGFHDFTQCYGNGK